MQKKRSTKARAELMQKRQRLLTTIGGIDGEDAPLATLREIEGSELRRIDAALARIDAGTWGECTECGEPIEVRRLDALPEAEACLACGAQEGRMAS
jgi:RNA polymerase-binding transcription factor DksA